MTQDLSERCAELVEELGLATREEVTSVTPLTGGVASDIAVVALPGRDVVVKFALAKLKVAEDWRAPVYRNKAEFAWLKVAHETCPENAPEVFDRSPSLQGFAMEFLHGDNVYQWKQHMLAGGAPDGEAALVGALLGRLHAISARDDFDQSPFHNRDDFWALRLEPYLIFTATRHPDLFDRLNGLAKAQYEASQVLVHGDVSPKNTLVRDGAPILLDAECATMGDASFDLAFCLNHLVIKALHLPANRAKLFDAALELWAAYAPHINWEEPAALEARVAALLPALMLGRVDGKSPVEYLDEAERSQLRQLAMPLISDPVSSLSKFVEILRNKVRKP